MADLYINATTVKKEIERERMKKKKTKLTFDFFVCLYDTLTYIFSYSFPHTCSKCVANKYKKYIKCWIFCTCIGLDKYADEVEKLYNRHLKQHSFTNIVIDTSYIYIFIYII